jgi:DNA-binding IclR family transcriptional regulator
MTLYELGQAVDAGEELKVLARPVMRDLMARTGESVFLGVLSDSRVTIIDIVESTKDLKVAASVGTRLPLPAGATGKVFLASMSDEEAQKLIRSAPLRAWTPNTITDPDRLLEEIRIVRRRGYALDDEEYIHGVRAVASLVPNPHRQMAAIWVVGLSPSMDAEKMEQIANQTRQAAQIIGRRLDEQG